MPVQTEPKKQHLRTLLFAFFSLVLSSGNEVFAQAETSKSIDVGFEAVIDGAYSGVVSGAGVLVLLPDAGFEKQGYFFLADGRGLRPHGVTFVLPRGLAPGRYSLVSPSPFDLGNVPSVRVDRDTGAAIIAADRNTSGFLNLTAFPADESKLTGSDVAGHFEFVTEDSEGRKINVNGAFAFTAK